MSDKPLDLEVKVIHGVSSGKPCIGGIRADIITRRFVAGENLAFIAEDYELDPLQIEAAIRYELWQFAKYRPKGMDWED